MEGNSLERVLRVKARWSGLSSDWEVVEQSLVKFDFGEVGRKRQ